MICKKCGKELGEEAMFCTSCGKKVKKKQKDGSQKKGKKGFVGILLFLVCVIVVAIAVIFVKTDKAGAKYEIDLGEYASVEFEGYSGIGMASLNFDKRKFFEDYEEKLKFPSKFKDKVEELGHSIKVIVNYCCDCTDIDIEDPDDEDATEFIYFFLFQDMSLRNNGYLKNGDEVELIWAFEEMWSEEEKSKICELFGVAVNYEGVNCVAHDLTEVPEFDPFEGVEISYSGAAPAGKALLANYPENGWSYMLVAPETVNNGDEIKVFIHSTKFSTEEYIKEYGKVPSTMEKTYIVSGLPTYISSASQIPEEILTEMQAQAEDIINGTTYGWSTGYTLDISYIGNYVMTAKEIATTPQNMVTLVYKLHYAKALVDYTGMAQEYATDYYYYVTWKNLTLEEDGTFAYDKNAYSKTRNEFTKGTNIFKEFSSFNNEPYWEYNITFPGYATLDEVYNQCVTQYIEKYKLEENIIK